MPNTTTSTRVTARVALARAISPSVGKWNPTLGTRAISSAVSVATMPAMPKTPKPGVTKISTASRITPSTNSAISQEAASPSR